MALDQELFFISVAARMIGMHPQTLRKYERLGRPERCPHGWPVDPDVEQAENRELVALSDLGAGERGTIVRLAEHDGELLHWFYDEGLSPGTSLEVSRSANGTLTVLAGGSEHSMDDKQAAGLFVRRAA